MIINLLYYTLYYNYEKRKGKFFKSVTSKTDVHF